MKPYAYWKNTPWWMTAILAVTIAIALFPLGNLIYFGTKNLEFGLPGKLDLTQLGLLGEFFGGHTSAFSGTVSLFVVLFFTFHQAKQQRLFFEEQKADSLQQSERDLLLQGINLITQWDIASPGCDQCMRLLDYYGRFALMSTDRELLLILNTVITAQIRANLEGKNGTFKRTNYPHACESVVRIAERRKEDSLALKAQRNVANGATPKNLSTP